MNLHKFLMGYRWNELPAQTVLDEKVSRIIGNVLIASLSLNIIAGHTIIHLAKKDKQ